MDSASVQIPNDVIQPIVEARIKAAIIEQLGSKDELIESCVKGILSQKVDGNGNPSSNSYGTFPLMDFLARKAVTEAAKAAIKEWAVSNGGKIELALKKEIARNTGNIAKGLAKSFIQKADSGWSVQVNLQVVEPN